MSNLSNYQMNLDIQQDYPQSRPYLRIDDREEITLDVTITSDGDTLDLTGYDIYFECKKSDGRIIRDAENVTLSGATSGKVSYKLNNEIATSSGHISIAYFALEKDGSRVTTRNFSLIVMPSAFTEFIASKNYLTEIEIIVNDITEQLLVNIDGIEEDFANQINIQIERIDELSKLIDDTIIEVNGKITGLTSDMDEFIVEINTQMESLRELVQIETDRVNSLIELIDNQEDVINDAIILMNEKIFLQEKLISDFQISVNARLEQINTDITNRVNEYISGSQAAIDEHVGESNDKLDALEDRIEGIESEVEDIDTYSRAEIDAKDDTILDVIGNLEELETENKEDIVSAINSQLIEVESGTWTPTLIGVSGEGDVSYSHGRYERIGNQVTIFFSIEGTKGTMTSAILIGGLPFQPNGQYGVSFSGLLFPLIELDDTRILGFTRVNSDIAFRPIGEEYGYIYADDISDEDINIEGSVTYAI